MMTTTARRAIMKRATTTTITRATRQRRAMRNIMHTKRNTTKREVMRKARSGDIAVETAVTGVAVAKAKITTKFQ
jgi:hypothetical protein